MNEKMRTKKIKFKKFQNKIDFYNEDELKKKKRRFDDLNTHTHRIILVKKIYLSLF